MNFVRSRINTVPQSRIYLKLTQRVQGPLGDEGGPGPWVGLHKAWEQGCGFVSITYYLAEWLERLTANAVVATVLGSIPASSDTVESKGRQMKHC
jgi:hypothetical protein